jgi:hypothetical protein
MPIKIKGEGVGVHRKSYIAGVTSVERGEMKEDLVERSYTIGQFLASFGYCSGIPRANIVHQRNPVLSKSSPPLVFSVCLVAGGEKVGRCFLCMMLR